MKVLVNFIFFIAFAGYTQTYTVIHAIGKIQDTESGKYLQKGMKIDASASLKFESNGARAAVLSSSRGRFVIQEQSSSSSGGDLSYALASVLSPARGRLSTRAGGINNQLDFEKHFGEGAIVMLNGAYSTSVSPTAYPVNDAKFFYAQYTYEGEAINKKLSSNEDKLVFESDQFFKIDDQPIDPNFVTDIKLFYYDSEQQESTLLTEVEFSILSKEDLKSIADQLSGEVGPILEIVNDLYGMCTEENLKQALSSL